MDLKEDKSGELVKLLIEAYKEVDYSEANRIKDLSFTAMFNPTTFNRKLEIEYGEKQGFGTTGAKLSFDKIKPQDYSMELFLDGTGTSGPKVDVATQVKKFIEVCISPDKDKHRPNYLMISHAKLILKVLLLNMDVTYTLFAKDGTPLRAKLAASFRGTIEDGERQNRDKLSSPDLTHERIVLEGDTLPLMTERIYGDPKYYMQVAKANGIKNFRKIEPGQKLFFPPIAK